MCFVYLREIFYIEVSCFVCLFFFFNDEAFSPADIKLSGHLIAGFMQPSPGALLDHIVNFNLQHSIVQISSSWVSEEGVI